MSVATWRSSLSSPASSYPAPIVNILSGVKGEVQLLYATDPRVVVSPSLVAVKRSTLQAALPTILQDMTAISGDMVSSLSPNILRLWEAQEDVHLHAGDLKAQLEVRAPTEIGRLVTLLINLEIQGDGLAQSVIEHCIFWQLEAVVTRYVLRD